MATSSVSKTATKTDAKAEVAPRARLHKLVIANFRAIGKTPVTIELDDIVVLVGPNNAGKSSVLRAYEVVMQAGKLNELTIEDFPNARVPSAENSDMYPTIELETVLYENSTPPAKHWIDTKENGDRHVRERWVWKDIGKPEKRGFNVESGQWDENHGPWGVASVAQANRPETHRIEAFDDPQKQAEAIIALLQEAIKEKVKEVSSKKGEKEAEKSHYELLLDSVAELQKQVAEDAATAIKDVRESLNQSISDVFPGYSITLDARPEDDLEKVVSFFKSLPVLRMGPNDGHQSTLERQGSGARRTLLWTALRILAEHKRIKEKSEVTERPHVLLLDEPEMCLHPSAIRDACNVLYSLPKSGKWQVMVTTHSPVFIDLSRDNTSIVRVEREVGGEVSGTTIFRPAKAKLTEDDKEELKLLNMYDPYVAEFFFGGKTIIVEGDTEHSAFREIVNSEKKVFGDVHVVRARGKYTIVALCKILNHFGSPYSVLHDADSKTITTRKGEVQANPAWKANEQILEVVSTAPHKSATLVASLPNFEEAMFGEPAKGEKPYGAWEKVRKNPEARKKVTELLGFLSSNGAALPSGALCWSSIGELEKAVGDQQA
ncbi:AAA family ATPase [Paraburkholderia sediminicola]|uniref:ATP-dependent nuclease n=1 Tax=Paraburkholderia sediminicola TaxID=458836 RepID=UPI0038B70DAB